MYIYIHQTYSDICLNYLSTHKHIRCRALLKRQRVWLPPATIPWHHIDLNSGISIKLLALRLDRCLCVVLLCKRRRGSLLQRGRSWAQRFRLETGQRQIPSYLHEKLFRLLGLQSFYHILYMWTYQCHTARGSYATGEYGLPGQTLQLRVKFCQAGICANVCVCLLWQQEFP